MHENAYVASVSLSADVNQTVKAFKEAEAYKGAGATKSRGEMPARAFLFFLGGRGGGEVEGGYFVLGGRGTPTKAKNHRGGTGGVQLGLRTCFCFYVFSEGLRGKENLFLFLGYWYLFFFGWRGIKGEPARQITIRRIQLGVSFFWGRCLFWC